MSRRRLLLAGGSLGAAALLVVGAAGLLRPSADSVSGTRGRSLLIPAAKRKALPDLAGAALLPPPAEIAFRDLRGKPAFLNIWASWCPSCKEEAPTMARLARKHGHRIRFVGIDVQDAREDGRAFVRRYGLDFPHIFDPKAEIATKLGVFGIPTAFLVDGRGRIAATLVGKQSEGKLRSYLRALSRER